jgi:hypothetical protein
MNGQPGGSTLGNTFGQGTSWVPLGLAAIGGGLAGAGRAGSPASNLGSGLMSSMLGYYANQAATADERARRMRLEDEALQRQKTLDTQNEQYRLMNLWGQTGGELGFDPTGGGKELGKIGTQSIYGRPASPFPTNSFIEAARAAYGEEGAKAIQQGIAGVSRKDLATVLPMLMQTAGVTAGQREGQTLSNMVEGLGQQKVMNAPSQEWAGATPPPEERRSDWSLSVRPPVLSPEQVDVYRNQVRIPETRAAALKNLDTHLQRFSPQSAGQGGPSATPPPGTSRATHWVQDKATGQWSQQITDTPENPQRALDTKETAATVAEAQRLEKSPGYKALYQAADPAGKEALTTFLNLAKQGIPAGLQSLVSAMSSTGTSPDSFDKARLAELRRTGRLGEYINNQVDASNPDRPAQQQLVNNLGVQIRLGEEEIGTLQPKHPQYAAKAKILAAKYREIADAAPRVWGKISFQRMAELLGWNEAQYKTEASQFAAQHGLQIKGGQ